MAAFTSNRFIGPPHSGFYRAGDTYEDANGTVFTCFDTGYPGGWGPQSGAAELFLVGTPDGLGTGGVRAGAHTDDWVPYPSPPPGIAGIKALESAETSSASRIKGWYHDTAPGVQDKRTIGLEGWVTFVPTSAGPTWTRHIGVHGTAFTWGSAGFGHMEGGGFECGNFNTVSDAVYSSITGLTSWAYNYGDGEGSPSFGDIAHVYGAYITSESFGGTVGTVQGIGIVQGVYGGANASYTGIDIYSWVGDWDVGTSPVVTTRYGFSDYLEIDSTGTVTTCYAVYIDWSNSGSVTTAWGFYQADDRDNFLGGALQVVGQLVTSASTTTRAGLVIASGSAPSSPAEGEMWYDGTNLVFRDSSTSRVLSWT